MKIAFGFVECMDAPEHLHKCVCQDISCFMLINSIAHGNSYGKAIELPVQLFLRLSIATTAVRDDAI